MQLLIIFEVKFRRNVSSAAHRIYLLRNSSDVSELKGVKNTVKDTLDVITSLSRAKLQVISQFLVS